MRRLQPDWRLRAWGSAAVGLSTVNLALTGLSLWLRVVAALGISAVVFAAGELTGRLIADRRPGADTERK